MIKMGTVSFSNTGGANSPARAPTRTVCNNILWDLSIFAAQQLCHHACPLACPGPIPPILLRRSPWHPQISQCQPTWGHCNTPRVGQPGSQGWNCTRCCKCGLLSTCTQPAIDWSSPVKLARKTCCVAKNDVSSVLKCCIM